MNDDIALNRAERRRLAKSESNNPIYDPTMKYFTMWKISNWLGVQPGTLSRWVNSWRLGRREGKVEGVYIVKGKSGGFNIPAPYALVAKGWTLTTDPHAREAMLVVLPTDPKPWVVVAGTIGYTCFTAEEASQKVTKVLTGEGIPETVQVFHVGEVPVL